MGRICASPAALFAIDFLMGPGLLMMQFYPAARPAASHTAAFPPLNGVPGYSGSGLYVRRVINAVTKKDNIFSWHDRKSKSLNHYRKGKRMWIRE